MIERLRLLLSASLDRLGISKRRIRNTYNAGQLVVRTYLNGIPLGETVF